MDYDPSNGPADLIAAAGLLHDTADILDRDGWTQHRMADEHNRACLLGALHRAQVERYCGTFMAVDGLVRSTAFGVRLLALHLLEQECALDPGHTGRYLARWNDHPGRTVEDVKLVLKHAEQRALDRAEAMS